MEAIAEEGAELMDCPDGQCWTGALQEIIDVRTTERDAARVELANMEAERNMALEDAGRLAAALSAELANAGPERAYDEAWRRSEFALRKHQERIDATR